MSENKGINTDVASKDVDGTLRVFYAIVALLVSGVLGWFVYSNATAPDANHPFKLGLDLAGGAHLVYEADVSAADPQEVPELMSVLRDVIERRINVFGVSEPIVQVEESSFVSGDTKERLVVELPGVTDIDEAIKQIGETPLLEFKLIDQEALAAQEALGQLGASASGSIGIGNIKVNGQDASNPYIDTGLTGRYLKSAALAFTGQQNGGGLSNEPIVQIQFNDEGAQLFEDITRTHVGEQLAIFLDGEILSDPRINEPISGGSAIISGGFDPEEAKALAQNLNFGALPVPIELISTQTIGASLGAEVLEKGVEAGALGLALVIGFMLLWYRVPGLVAGIALAVYTIIMLALFQLIPVTLTAAGLAGFVLSIGMAVDANVLVFERMKEEFKAGKNSRDAARIGFARAWSAIRDGNLTSIFSAVILFWFGTSIVKGFALVFGLGVVVSMFTALTVTRTLLMALPEWQHTSKLACLFSAGITRKQTND